MTLHSLTMPNGTIEKDIIYWSGDRNEICPGLTIDANEKTELKSGTLVIFIALIFINLTGIALLIYLCFFGEDKMYQCLL